MSKQTDYIPALKYDWLTKVYDPVLQFTMPERKFKSALIRQMEIKPNDRILDFGCGSLTLSIMAAQRHPHAQFFGVDIDAKIISIAREKLSKTNLSIDLQQTALPGQLVRSRDVKPGVSSPHAAPEIFCVERNP